MPIHHHQDKPLIVPHAVDAAALTLRGVNFAYPDGHQALKNISLEIAQGEKVALVGPNGAGKSTLLLQLNGVFQGEGEIQVMGLPVLEKNLPLIRAYVGMVFQNPDDQLFSPTVFEDVAFGPLHMGLASAEVRARAAEALQQVGMEAYSERLSYHLSLGEKKRIAIATVLSMHPDILVFDEPTGGLDPRSRRSLIELLDAMEITMLVSTHDMRLVQELFPRMVIMDGGQIVADGSAQELLADQAFLHSHGLEQP
ncbi:MAG: cobalt ABC transporter ATP-binding protein [Chloroflexota bacterium]|nr:MAG: cobalt ABC transporter ATP-binding protein [Anaerolineaceae bacterium 4572_5.2]RLD08446.1 MAG: cobalt ABC transporter ATP-binding protein [Chloroflexota bacterium]